MKVGARQKLLFFLKCFHHLFFFFFLFFFLINANKFIVQFSFEIFSKLFIKKSVIFNTIVTNEKIYIIKNLETFTYLLIREIKRFLFEMNEFLTLKNT